MKKIIQNMKKDTFLILFLCICWGNTIPCGYLFKIFNINLDNYTFLFISLTLIYFGLMGCLLDYLLKVHNNELLRTQKKEQDNLKYLELKEKFKDLDEYLELREEFEGNESLL